MYSESGLSNSRRIKCLTVADNFSHECVKIVMDYGISGQYVTRLPDKLPCSGATPYLGEQTSDLRIHKLRFMAWATSYVVKYILIQLGSPMQNGYIKSFNAKTCGGYLKIRPDNTNTLA